MSPIERAYGPAMTYTALTLPVVTDAHRTATKNRLGGSRIAAIKRAWHAIDSRCVTCASPTWVGTKPADMGAGDEGTFGHVIPASVITPGAEGGERGGYTADNGVLQCKDCQHALGDVTLTRVAFLPAYFGTFPKAPRVARVEAGGERKAAARLALGY